jgi:hypothetical protein
MARKGKGNKVGKIQNQPKWLKAHPNVVRLIKGRTVNISAASNYSKKGWNIQCDAMGRDVKKEGKNEYALSPPFFGVFLSKLRSVLASRVSWPSMNAADLIAGALCSAAYEMEDAYSAEFDPSDELPVWSEERPISDAWEQLGDLPIPWPESIVLEEWKDQWGPARAPEPARDSMVLRECKDQQRPLQAKVLRNRVAIGFAYEQKKENLPNLTVEIEGAPVCLLMKASSQHPCTPDERDSNVEAAQRLWTRISRRLSSFIGVGQLQPGKPQTGLGWRAAVLRDHAGFSWPKVARELCPKNHKHDSSCADNYRKQAEQYWNKLRKKARIHTPLKS